MNYTDEELLDALRSFHDREGRSPTTAEANDPETDLPTQVTYRSHFGSWDDAIDAAGTPPRQGSSRKYTDDELLDALREYADEHGRPPTTTEANDGETLANASTFRTRFGSWSDAIDAAGVPPRQGKSPTYTDEELLDILREYVEEHGQTPISREVDDDETLPSASTFRTRFGSWNGALEAAGIPPREGNSPKYTDDELLDALREYADEHERRPTSTEANDPATDLPTAATFADRFGSWSNALERAGFFGPPDIQGPPKQNEGHTD